MLISHAERTEKDTIRPYDIIEGMVWIRKACRCLELRDGADKSLARPGRKQATATKLARRLTCFLSASVRREDMNRPLFPMTISIPSYDIGK
jgi:hypothetical protein